MKRIPFAVCLVLLLLVLTGIPAAATPTISRIEPASAPNTGDVTVTITGTGFNANSTVMLSSQAIVADAVYGTIVSWSPTSITCTFPIQGRTPTRYYIAVNSPFLSPVDGRMYEDAALSSQSFTISPGVATTVTITTTPVPLYGNISVSSVPAGANIYLDNEYRGLTPLTMKNVENGDHVVLVRLTGYQDWKQDVVVFGNSQSLSAGLRPVPAPTTAPTKIPKIYITDTTPVATAQKTKSPLGIETGIIATMGAALLLMKRK
ncbi:MAG: PEGA domain-containing protein [Methanoregula sp.]|nr:PEGA domain-containing protein [Methanoregula sp.]